MRYKRNEPFRYVFEEPLMALIQIVKVNNQPTYSSLGEAKVIDISPEGIRISTNLIIPDKSVELEITFILNEQEINLIGNIVWEKQIGTSYDHGLKLLLEEDERNKLVDQLEKYVKK